MKNYKYTIYAIVLLLSSSLLFSSCLDDLNRFPDNEFDKGSELVFGSEIDAYQMSLAKIYAGLAIAGNKGGDGEADVQGVDGGSQASFLRGLWNLQELPTDEAHTNWDDTGLPDFNYMTWNAGNPFIKGQYYRLHYQVSLANEFLRETTDSKLSSRGMAQEVMNEVHILRADARFMRALAYYYLLDLFRNVPFTTEESSVGLVSPSQIQGAKLFEYIESELKAIDADLLAPFIGYHSEYYGRVNKAAAWSLLSRLYLNAEVYAGVKKYKEAAEYAEKVMGVGYELEPIYDNMFNIDNDKSKEMIFPIRYMGPSTQTWGGMTFIICSTVPSTLQDDVNSVGAWQGNRSRSSLVKLFDKQPNYNDDGRKAMLRADMTASAEINDVFAYKDNGTPVVKFVNRTKDGQLPPGGSNLVYIDFPLFRLAEIYLNYAEAVLKDPASGDKAKALELVNKIRERGFADKSKAKIADSQLTLDFILDEKAREFFFEAQRRTDLVRHGKLTGDSYIWEWKGGAKAGKTVAKHFDIYPIPTSDLSSNSNLEQNPEY